MEAFDETGSWAIESRRGIGLERKFVETEEYWITSPTH